MLMTNKKQTKGKKKHLEKAEFKVQRSNKPLPRVSRPAHIPASYQTAVLVLFWASLGVIFFKNQLNSTQSWGMDSNIIVMI